MRGQSHHVFNDQRAGTKEADETCKLFKEVIARILFAG